MMYALFWISLIVSLYSLAHWFFPPFLQPVPLADNEAAGTLTVISVIITVALAVTIW
jgi:hypothetical protein